MIISIAGVVNFNHTSGCQKCLVEGKFSKNAHRMFFSKFDCTSRTDSSFRLKLHPKHHKEYSLMEDLPMNMIQDFPTSDPLHLLELGVMKRYSSSCYKIKLQTRWIKFTFFHIFYINM